MKKLTVAFAAALLLAASLAVAETAPGVAKNYQVTGQVLELTDTMIVVQKDKDRWEIARNKETEVAGALKVGEKVTVRYKMTAASIKVKAKKDRKK